MKHTTNENIALRQSNIDRLPVVVVTSFKTAKLLGVFKLPSGTGKDQASAVFNSFNDWQLKDDVIGMSSDTTASNTGRLNEACVLLEKRIVFSMQTPYT